MMKQLTAYTTRNQWNNSEKMKKIELKRNFDVKQTTDKHTIHNQIQTQILAFAQD